MDMITNLDRELAQKSVGKLVYDDHKGNFLTYEALLAKIIQRIKKCAKSLINTKEREFKTN